MTPTAPITRAFDTEAQAQRTHDELIAAGIPDSAISFLTRAADGTVDKADTGDAVATGATVGTIIGGGLGTLAGLGAMAIPGVGPIVAAGWLVAALTGAGAGAAAGAGVAAAAGGLYDGLHKTGLSDEEAHFYAESVKRGGTLLLVRTDDMQERAMATEILNRSGHVDVASRSAEWRDAGWRGYQENDVSIDQPRRYGS